MWTELEIIGLFIIEMDRGLLSKCQINLQPDWCNPDIYVLEHGTSYLNIRSDNYIYIYIYIHTESGFNLYNVHFTLRNNGTNSPISFPTYIFSYICISAGYKVIKIEI